MTAKGWSCGRGKHPSHHRGRVGVGVGVGAESVRTAAAAAAFTIVSDRPLRCLCLNRYARGGGMRRGGNGGVALLMCCAFCMQLCGDSSERGRVSFLISYRNTSFMLFSHSIRLLRSIR